MRVISGKYKGRILKFPKSKDIRPLQERAKEALFQILDVENKSVLDIYAGSGQLGIEALSRGAKSVIFVDSNKMACKIIKENLLSLREERSNLMCMTAERFLANARNDNAGFDFIIANPPFAKIDLKVIEQLFYSLSVGGILVFIHASRDEINVEFAEIIDSRTYGDTRIDFYIKTK